MSKERLDMALVTRGLVDSRARARDLIVRGEVLVDNAPARKASQAVFDSQQIVLRGDSHQWVSRGALKLIGALDAFKFDIAGKIALDIGASTGGFTEVLLAREAAHVYAVDVGHGQLAKKLVADDRVTNMEKLNARYIDSDLISEPIDILVCDASFISLQKLLGAPLELVKAGGVAISLIKPQFQLEPGQVGKGGVVRDEALHEQVCKDVKNWFKSLGDWQVDGIIDSPITGPDGNKEFLIKATRNES